MNSTHSIKNKKEGTSAFMAQWLWIHKRKEFDIHFIFANTGLENEETLQFVEQVSDHWGFHVFWIEAKVMHGEKKSSGYEIVSPEIASRNGEPFEQVIKKYGIPNMKFPHCTRELKERPINAWAKEHLIDYHTAIGIRCDEADRMNPKAKEKKLCYPLISMQPMTKPMINFFWQHQPFRLNLKDYQGNCKTCWKKSDIKLWKIAQEKPSHFDFMNKMEDKYGLQAKKDIDKRITFFRNNRSAKDILRQAGELSQQTSIEFYDLVGGDSCEVFSECGS